MRRTPRMRPRPGRRAAHRFLAAIALVALAALLVQDAAADQAASVAALNCPRGVGPLASRDKSKTMRSPKIFS